MHTEMLSKVGLAQGVLVQPGLYGDDPSAIIDALQQADGRISGIAVATGDVTDAELDRLHASGVRGLRFNEMTVPGGTERFSGAVGVGALDTLAPRMRDRGWHAEVWARIDQHAALLPRYRASGIPVCLDHMAGLDVTRGVDAPEFQAILSALNEGWLWVKLVLCRCSQDFPKYADLRPYHDALLEANPDRLVWGSDWPHLRLGDKAPDVGDLLDLFRDWVPNGPLRHRILVENPRILYGC
jgi:predicted TIM-barrel fold metal-dependent hydrolase